VAESLDVVAAVVERDGRYLITRRLEGTHLAGLWEFPGGKLLPGEQPEDALKRELREELGVGATVGEPIETVDWTYPDKTVRLRFFHCTLVGEPAPLEGQEMRWAAQDDLRTYRFPEADAALIERLSGFCDQNP
jgi:8-oxo-dGTP diphosphatase